MVGSSKNSKQTKEMKAATARYFREAKKTCFDSSKNIFLGFVERAYNLPPMDRPIVVPTAEAEANHKTLSVMVSKKVDEAKAILEKKANIADAESYVFEKFQNQHSKTYYFQESESAPAASSFPPPENDDDPALRPKYRTFDLPRTVPVGSIDKILAGLGIASRAALPGWFSKPEESTDEDEEDGTTKKADDKESGNNRRKTAAKRGREESAEKTDENNDAAAKGKGRGRGKKQ